MRIRSGLCVAVVLNSTEKENAACALLRLSQIEENKIRAVEAGIMKPLVELMADFGSNMVDKSGFVLSLLVSVAEARVAVVEEGGIPMSVEIVEVGSQKQKEIAAAILLSCVRIVRCIGQWWQGKVLNRPDMTPLLAFSFF